MLIYSGVDRPRFHHCRKFCGTLWDSSALRREKEKGRETERPTGMRRVRGTELVSRGLLQLCWVRCTLLSHVSLQSSVTRCLRTHAQELDTRIAILDLLLTSCVIWDTFLTSLSLHVLPGKMGTIQDLPHEQIHRSH